MQAWIQSIQRIYTSLCFFVNNIFNRLPKRLKLDFYTLYILPDDEGNSVGTQLLNLIKEQAVQLNVAKLMIESILNALTYYERLGFVNNGLISDGATYDLELQLECVKSVINLIKLAK